MELAYAGYVVVALLGLVMGSFAGATVWRLRARQLVQDQKDGEDYDKTELKRLMPLTQSTVSNDRSRCLSCQHELNWYDLLPLVSWVSTNGKCRYCKASIGWFEPLMEIGMATVFVIFYHFWLSVNGLAFIELLVLWLVMIVMLGILFAYDLKWFLLPDAVMFPLIGLAGVYAAYMLAMSGDQVIPLVANTVASIAILGGLYLVLWIVSKGLWVGFGDVKLGLALGLLLMDWKLALLTLFLANLIGTLIVLPGMLSGKLSRKTQVPFGPLLIAGFFISLVFGRAIIDGYTQFSLWLTSAMLML